MNDSQEYTIENFAADSICVDQPKGQKCEQVPTPRNVSVPSGSSKCSYHEHTLRNGRGTVPYIGREVPQETYKPTPMKLSDRMHRLNTQKTLQSCIPTQNVGSPESIKTPDLSESEILQSLEHKNIYLYDLHEGKQELCEESFCNLEGLNDDSLESIISNDPPLAATHNHQILKKNLSSIFEMTDESQSKENLPNLMNLTKSNPTESILEAPKSTNSNEKQYNSLKNPFSFEKKVLKIKK